MKKTAMLVAVFFVFLKLVALSLYFFSERNS